MWTGRGNVIEKGAGCLYLGKVMKKCSRIERDDINVTTKSKGFKTCYALRKMGSGNKSRLEKIR